MLRIILVTAIVLNTGFVDAQSSDPGFGENETQIKCLVEQIGALKALGDAITKGYDIAHNGLANIFNSKDADYQQHSSYFLSLGKVKPGIKNYSKVFSILSRKANIEKQFRLIKSSSTDFLNNAERSYVNSVYATLISGCRDLADELQMVVDDDRLQLKDDERIQRIDRLYIEMEDRYEFSCSFANQIKRLGFNRLREQKEVNKLNWLHRVK